MTVGTVTAADGLREYAGDYARDLVTMLERTVADRGASVAFVDDARRVTWSEFGDEVESLARCRWGPDGADRRVLRPGRDRRDRRVAVSTSHSYREDRD
jgi:hypothetical protein